MPDLRRCLPMVATLMLLGAPARAAEGPPKLDITSTCKAVAPQGADPQDADRRERTEGCLRSERAAREEAAERWNTFTPAAKSQCEKQHQAGGYPSYVELLTCLELASGFGPRPADGDRTDGERAGSPAAGSRPERRTDPIGALGRPVR